MNSKHTLHICSGTTRLFNSGPIPAATRLIEIMPEPNHQWIVPDWPCPAKVHAIVTTRAGGVSSGAFASLNLGDAVGDDAGNVQENRRRLALHLPSTPKWLKQVHGSTVVVADTILEPLAADAAFTASAGVVCAVQMADCLPLLLCTRDGSKVAAVHAGWRGLCSGIVENAVHSLGDSSGNLMAYLGPAIGPNAFEVGDDVYSAFVGCDAQASTAFRSIRRGKWLADLFTLARQRLRTIGVEAIYGGDFCTHSEASQFFSHRRDKISGRMAALIWRSD